MGHFSGSLRMHAATLCTHADEAGHARLYPLLDVRERLIVADLQQEGVPEVAHLRFAGST